MVRDKKIGSRVAFFTNVVLPWLNEKILLQMKPEKIGKNVLETLTFIKLITNIMQEYGTLNKDYNITTKMCTPFLHLLFLSIKKHLFVFQKIMDYFSRVLFSTSKIFAKISVAESKHQN
jgi:hypothetical protein